jgi:hypothetical protein
MALFPTNAAQVQAFAGALYGVQVGSTTMTQVNSDIAAAGGLTNALNAYYTASFGNVATATVAASLVANIGISAANAEAATAYVAGVLNGTAANARGAAIMNILNLLSSLTADATYGADAAAWNTKVETAVAYTGSSNVTMGSTVSQGSTFVLTTGVDTFTGTSGNDTFTADNTSTDVSSTADVLNGGEGTDTLNVFSDGAAGAMPALTSVEVLNVYDQDNDMTTAAASLASLNTVNLVRGDGALTLTVGANVANVGLTDIVADGDTDGAGTGAGVIVAAAATATSLNLSLNGVTAAAETGITDENVDVNGAALTTLNVTTSGTASSFDLLDAASATTISINAGAALTTVLETGATAASLSLSGAGAVNLGALDSAINTVTSTATGALTADIGANVDTVLTAGSGNDVITASSTDTIATTDALAVNGGDGTDVLVISATADVNTAADGARYTNFETVRTGDSYDGDLVAGITALQLTGAASKSYTDLTATQAAAIQVRGDETSATFALKTATGTSDALTLTMGTGLTTSAATDIVTGMTVTGFETLNIIENGGATASAGADRTAVVAAFTGATLNDINLSGRAVTLSNIATTVAVNIDGSALTGNGATGTDTQALTVDGSAVAGSVITGSALRDSFTVGAEGSTYNGGAGNDAFSATVALLTADGSTDLVLNGDAGTDTLTLSNTTDNTITDNQFTNVHGFEKLTLTNTGAADTSISTGAAFNAAFADGATITSGVIAATYDITIAAGLSTVATTVSIAATSQTGASTETNSITTGSAADSVTYTDADWVGTTGGAQGTIVIDTRGGNDTISVTVGTLVAADTSTASTGQAISITGGAGQDSITKVGTNSAKVVGTAVFNFAAGDSSTTAWDSITGFDAANTTFSDKLDFEGTAAVSAFTATEDFGVIKSHSITTGYASFDDVADYSAALVINATNLADVVGYLKANVAANGTVAFAYDSDASGTADATMVFHQGSGSSVADDLVMLVGITSGTLTATLTTTTAGAIAIA